MKLFGLQSLFLTLLSTHAFARVAQILPNGDLAPSQGKIVYTRMVEQPAFYEKPLFVGMIVFTALIIGLVIGLIIARRKGR